jgi:hypothetical protein
MKNKAPPTPLFLIPELELMASHLLGKPSTTPGATPSVRLLFSSFQIGFHVFCGGQPPTTILLSMPPQ